MDQNHTPNTRLYVLAGFLVAVLLVYLGVLYDIQVVHHEDYLAQSVRSIAREETVDASRGIITDRSGRTLVSNAYAYNLTFNASELDEDEDQNIAILRLVQLCQKEGYKWVDNLPISDYAPFIYEVDSLNNTQKGRFLTYLRSLKGPSELLDAYLLEHPELAAIEEEEEVIPNDAFITLPEEEPETPVVLTAAEQGKALLAQMPAASLTEQMLTEAGVTAPYLV